MDGGDKGKFQGGRCERDACRLKYLLRRKINDSEWGNSGIFPKEQGRIWTSFRGNMKEE